jgi:hypothetical protein
MAFTTFSSKRGCGCADIIADEGKEVWGLLYHLTDLDQKNLDIAEGHPHKYKRFPTKVLDENGIMRTADTYEVVHKSVMPSRLYRPQ